MLNGAAALYLSHNTASRERAVEVIDKLTVAAATSLFDDLDVRAGKFRVNSTGIGMNGKTPVIQGPAIADANGTLADATSKLNTLLAYLRSRGDIAT